MIIGVLVEISHKNIDRLFEYHVPKELENSIKIGIRVLVPFGTKTLEGFVLEIKNHVDTDKELKSIIDVVDDEAYLNKELLELGKIMQRELYATLISCYQVMLPKSLKAKNKETVGVKLETFYTLNKDKLNIKINDTQQRIINLFKDKKEISRKELINISLSSVNTLVKKEILIPLQKEKYRLEYQKKDYSKKELTPAQREVVEEVINNPEQCFLLYGVTGSGKTEVYMEIIDYYLKQGKTSIVLVPEISLTPQMIERFQSRFGKNIAAIHSGLSDGEKYDEYRRIHRKEAQIVIGARSAVFAPLENIGIIILDEEHSDSYKQSDPNPRYHARDIAKLRAKYHQASVLLGSATPSLESMARAGKGVYHYLTLKERVNGKQLPKVTIIDMNKEGKTRNHFSKTLLAAIKNRLEKKEQIILLLNRRGYASFVTCKNCGHTFKCPNCDITLTYHKSSNTLRCHYCGYGEKNYTECPKCHEKSLQNLGVGTQRVEEELNKEFPNSRILRMDYDTTSRKGMHEKMIEEFKNENYDILLGTQMVSKGLDFPNVTLVGVINADTSLNIPDFRSSENTFSLLNQVSGRSGRSNKEGEVMIQTYNPDHYAIALTKNHNYPDFYKQEMKIRKAMKYPPYYYLCSIRIKGKDSKIVWTEANKIKNYLEKNLSNSITLGPTPANIFKMHDIYRYNIIIKYKNIDNLHQIFPELQKHYLNQTKVSLDIDFNPSQMT